jgi:hypothetical protein
MYFIIVVLVLFISIVVTLVLYKFSNYKTDKLNNCIIIRPVGGLCNYLRVIFSYYEYTKSINCKLVVIWYKTEECNGYFLDYFEPVEGVEFLEDRNMSMRTYIMSFIYNVHYTGWAVHPDYSPNYTKLKLLPYIFNIVKSKIDSLQNNYIAVHIRRTDHIQAAKDNNSYTTDSDFINFINNFRNNKNLYIATDNKKTYDMFSKNYNNMVKFNYHNVKSGLRETTMEDAIIDMFMCKYANEFMGSGYSSFSDTIYALRDIKDQTG